MTDERPANRFELKYPPPAVLAVCALAMIVLAFLMPDFGISGGDPLKSAVASMLAAVGIAFAVAGVVQFRMKRTTVHPMHPERASALVSDGVYGLTRNPMYLGMALLLAGFAVYALHLSGVLATVAFVGWIMRFQIMPEERAMEARFGAAYANYCRRVRRWI